MACRCAEITRRRRTQGNTDFLGQNKKSFHQRQNDQKREVLSSSTGSSSKRESDSELQQNSKRQKVTMPNSSTPEASSKGGLQRASCNVEVGNPLTQCIVRVKGGGRTDSIENEVAAASHTKPERGSSGIRNDFFSPLPRAPLQL